jgi:hypothetical protein
MSSEIEYLKLKVDSLETNMVKQSDHTILSQTVESYVAGHSDVTKEMKETNKALRDLAESIRMSEAEKKHRDKEIETIQLTLASHQKVIGSVELLMHDQKKKDKKWGVVEKVVITVVTGGFLALIAEKIIM